MIEFGDCLACRRLGVCPETDLKKVWESYTCALFEGAPEPVYQARIDMMAQFGEIAAIQAMLNRPPPPKEEEK